MERNSEVMTITYREYKKRQRDKVYRNGSWAKDFHENGVLYLLILPIIVYFIIFSYVPMFGIAIAFEDYKPLKGVFGSEWVGFANFEAMFSSEEFLNVLRNTACMGILNVVLGFIAPVFFALVLSQIRFKRFKRGVQLISYMPNFCSTMVIVTLATQFLAYDGFITEALAKIRLVAENGWLQENSPAFWLINCLISIWQGFGWGSIVYVAAISNINGDLYEAAAIDGAGRGRRLWSITLPGIKSLCLMLLTVNIGVLFMTGFDKVMLLYNEHIYEYADCLHSYTYRYAFGQFTDYGFSTASGLFQSLISMFLLIISNLVNRKVSDMALF